MDGAGTRLLDRPVRRNWRRFALGSTMTLLNGKQAWAIANETLGMAEASAIKVYGLSSMSRRTLAVKPGRRRDAQDRVGWSRLSGRLERFYRMSLVLTFGGGCNEVEDMIAMAGSACRGGDSDGFYLVEEQRAVDELAEEVLSAHLDASDFSGLFARRLYAELARTELLRVELSTGGGMLGLSKPAGAAAAARRSATPLRDTIVIASLLESWVILSKVTTLRSIVQGETVVALRFEPSGSGLSALLEPSERTRYGSCPAAGGFVCGRRAGADVLAQTPEGPALFLAGDALQPRRGTPAFCGRFALSAPRRSCSRATRRCSVA